MLKIIANNFLLFLSFRKYMEIKIFLLNKIVLMNFFLEVKNDSIPNKFLIYFYHLENKWKPNILTIHKIFLMKYLENIERKQSNQG